MQQIPKWYRQRIKDFEKLTELEQIFEYESLKIRERTRKLAKKLGIKGFKAPKIIRPEAVAEKTIEELKERAEEFKQAPFQPEYTGGQLTFEAPKPQEEYEEDYSSEYEMAEEFVEDMLEYIQRECSNEVIRHSTYRSGRQKSRKTIEWYKDNIEKGENLLIRTINQLTSTPEKKLDFFRRLSLPTTFGPLMDAMGEYIASLYYSVNAENEQYSKLYVILIGGPITMDDAMQFEDEE